MVNVKNKHYTQEQISDANMVDLPLFLQRQGEKLIKAGKEYRLGSNHSVTVYKNQWYDHAEGKGGHSIDFVMWLYHCSFPQAIDVLLSANHIKAITNLEREQNSVVLKKFELPPRNSNNKRVFAYLQKTRKIDAEIINHCIKKQILYEESVHHNCVFVGNDMSGTARYAMMRGTLAYGDRQYKREHFGSKKQYGFRFGDQAANKIYIFESPIDAMSYASLRKNSGENWRDSNYLSLGGVSEKALEYFLKNNSAQIKQLVFCLDNDEAGNNASIHMMNKYKGDYLVIRHTSLQKDFNVDLVKQDAAKKGRQKKHEQER